MKVCSVKGCIEKSIAKSYCEHHYNSFYRYGNVNKAKKRVIITKDEIDWSTAGKRIVRGYYVLRKTINYKYYSIAEHRYIWELHNGKIPNNMVIHHKNENKLDNNIDNLELYTISDHLKLHGGEKYINGEWYKLCPLCNELKKANNDNFNKYNNWLSSHCKSCYKTHRKILYNKNKERINELKRKNRKKNYDENKESINLKKRIKYQLKKQLPLSV